MEQVRSYNVAIKDTDNGLTMHCIKETIKYAERMIADLIPIVELHYDDFTENNITTQKAKQAYIEKLFHKTRTNPNPKYEWIDKKYYKTPTYLRRALITYAIGQVQSYKERYNTWLTNGKHGNPPQLKRHHKCPQIPLYRKNMYEDYWVEDNKYYAHIKLRYKGDWKYFTITLSSWGIIFIKKQLKEKGGHLCAPSLVRDHKRNALRFTIEEYIDLPKLLAKDRKVCAIDLGYNKQATCVAMKADGTVIARKFISYDDKKDQIISKMERISRAQENGSVYTHKMWTFINNDNAQLSNLVVTDIIEFAKNFECDVLVFEYLDFNKHRVRGKNAAALSHWRWREIQKKCEERTHRCGMRFARVCAWQTSQLAFDGSGKVKRGDEITPRSNHREPYSYSIVEFSTGKLYDADLNAAYNIAARYFIRELCNELSEEELGIVWAKVPAASKRSTCTLATLKDLWAVLGTLCV